jgi:class 3 adenylate cyclase/tetratricopeptide (TPR) repeat protein
MQCPNCQAALPEAAKFCIECGAAAPSVCGACGFTNLPKATFCADCGVRLESSRGGSATSADAESHPAAGRPLAPSVERRQLTVLFCDLVGSTPLSSRLDPEELRDVIAAFYTCVADTVAAFGGHVARYMGDGALIFFGYPHAYEDNAGRAIRGALALVKSVRELDVHAERLSVRIGIATGLVVVGDVVSAGFAREMTALGDTPNLAARLQATAEPNAIVIADTTKRLAGGLFEYLDLGGLALKGFTEPVNAWQVVGEERSRRRFNAQASGRHPLAQPQGSSDARPLVGRVRELGLLHHNWKQVCEGRGRVVVVSGDAGIGKSRLIQALISQLGDQPHAHLEFHCAANYVNSPLYPVVALLPAVLEWSRADAIETRLEKLDAFCARHRLPTEALPLLASLLSLRSTGRFAMPSMSPERQKQQTLQLLVAIVVSFAAEQPLTMVVEDLHWIDPTSKHLLALLIEQAPTVPLFMLLTARLEFAPSWQTRTYVTPLTLSRLSRTETEEMIVQLAGGSALPVEVAGEIVSRTDGVPLFVEELTKMLLESHLIQASEGRYALTGQLPPLAIPTTLQDSLAARLDRLGSVKPLAQLCATLGREFSYALLQAVSASDDSSLQTSLDQLVYAEFLQQQGAGPEAVYTFKHALIQEAAYHSLLKSRRQQFHGRIATVLLDQFPSEAEAHPEVVALHHTRAADFDTAVSWWQKAGQHAFRRASFAEAIAHYSSGLRVLESLPDDRRRAQLELALQVELGYSLIPLRGWSALETAQAFSRAGELSRQIGDTPSQFRALWGVGAFHFVRGDQHKAHEIAEQCLALAQQVNDVDALIEGHYLLGITRCVGGDFVSGCAELERAVALYGKDVRETHRLLYGQDAKAAALGWLAMARWVLGHPDESLAKAQEGLAFVRDATQPFLLARGMAGVGFIHVFRREPRGSDSELSAVLALCAEQGFAYFHAVVSAFQGANLVLLDDARRGVELMQASLVALRTAGSELLLTLILVNLADAELTLGHIDEARSVLEEGFEAAERNGEHWADSELLRIRGQLLLLDGSMPAEAEECLRKSLAVARGQRAKAFELRASVALARSLQQRHRHEEAAGLLAEALGAWPIELDSVDLCEARQLLEDVRFSGR